MKNYKLLEFNKEKLKELGFSDTFMDVVYSKRYTYNHPYGTVELKICKNKEYIYFYNSRFFLPCELKDEIGIKGEKNLKKEIKEDLKVLKELGIISR